MTVVNIGGDMCRTKIKSDRLREKLSKIPGAIVSNKYGEKLLYFPIKYKSLVEAKGKTRKARKKEATKQQLNLF